MIGKWVAVLLLASPAGIAAAQQPATAKPNQQSQAQNQSQNAAQKKTQQDSLAAAARRTREQQKSQPRAAKVWDNDNLPAAPEAVSVVGSTPATPAESTDQSSAGAAETQQGKSSQTSAASTTGRKADLQKQLDAAKAHLKSAQTDLDIATRKYQLDQQTYYSNPNYLGDRAGAAKLKNEQSDIDAKKQAVDAAQKQVDDISAKLQDLQAEPANSSNTPQ